MKVAIVGMNQLVAKIGQDFARQKDDISVLYQNRRVLPSLQNLEGVDFVEIEDFQDDFLENARLKEAQAVFLCTESDGLNLFLARLLQDKDYVYAFVQEEDLAELTQAQDQARGRTRILNGPRALAKSVTKLFYQDGGVPVDVFGPFDLAFTYYRVRPGMEGDGQAIQDIPDLDDFLIVSVLRDGDLFVPHGRTRLEVGDRLALVGRQTAIQRFKRRYSAATRLLRREDVHHFIVFGASDYSRAVAASLLKEGADVTLCSEDKEALIDLSMDLPDLRCVYGDGRQKAFQESLEVEEADGVIAASPDEGANILISLLARDLGQERVVMTFYSPDLALPLYKQDFLATLNPSFIMSQEVKLDLMGPQDLSFFLLPGQVQVYEVLVQEDSEALGQKLEDLDLPQGFLLAGILREDGTSLVAKGHTRIFKGDRVLAFVMRGQEEALKKFINVQPGRSWFSEILNLF